MRIVPAEGKADGEAGGKFDDKLRALGDWRLDISNTSLGDKDRL
jgi:hypothetical protein